MNNALFNSLEKHLQHKFKQSEYQTIQYFKLYRFLLKEFVIKWLFHWVVTCLLLSGKKLFEEQIYRDF